MKNLFFITLESRKFIIGSFSKVIEFLLNKNTSSVSQVILPSSLHDLALSESVYSYDAVDYCTSDSMWLTYFFRLKLGKKIDRVYGPDLMLTILNKEQNADSINKHFFLAADSKINKKMLSFLTKRYGKLNINCNFLNKKLSEQAEKKYLESILYQEPDFIWIGIGSPKQLEIANWLKNHSKKIKIFCVGAAFNFISGDKPQAPFLIQRVGLEWLFRLCNEPIRLWRRYLVVIPKYIFKRLLYYGLFK